MEFSGGQLEAILREQTIAVDLFDEVGNKRINISARYAAEVVMSGQYVGIGHKKRIRYVRPAGLVIKQRPFVIADELIDAKRHPRLIRVVEKNATRDRQTWPQQAAFASTGTTGSSRRVFFTSRH